MPDNPCHRLHPTMLQRARELRRPLTPAEALLWAQLRNRRCGGFKFRRQEVIDRFIADFECREVKLIVEVDGATHHYTEEYDAERTEWLGSHGYKVIRFSNADVQSNLEGVIEMIRQECERRNSSLSKEYGSVEG